MVDLLKKNTHLILVILAWTLISLLFTIKVPPTNIGHDVGDHKKYTNILIKENRTPKRDESWVAHQPPLYYSLISVFVKGKTDKVHHKIAQVISIIFGIGVIILLNNFINLISSDQLINSILLLFLVTNPKFHYTFNTYNNDTLGILLPILLMYLISLYFKKDNKKYIVAMLGVSIAIFYTKYTAVWAMMIISLIVLYLFINSKITKKQIVCIASIFFIAFLSHAPYLYFTNYKTYGSIFMPLKPQYKNQKDITFDKFKNTFLELTNDPLFIRNRERWQSPWVAADNQNPTPIQKRDDFLTTSLVTGILTEKEFPTVKTSTAWSILYVHCFLGILALIFFRTSSLATLSFIFICLAMLLHLILVSLSIKPPVFTCSMDHRYLQWDIVFWAILYANVLKHSKSWLKTSTIIAMLIGVLFHLNMLFSIS